MGALHVKRQRSTEEERDKEGDTSCQLSISSIRSSIHSHSTFSGVFFAFDWLGSAAVLGSAVVRQTGGGVQTHHVSDRADCGRTVPCAVER